MMLENELGVPLISEAGSPMARAISVNALILEDSIPCLNLGTSMYKHLQELVSNLFPINFEKVQTPAAHLRVFPVLLSLQPLLGLSNTHSQVMILLALLMSSIQRRYCTLKSI